MLDHFKKSQQQLGPPKWFFSNELHGQAWPAFLANPVLRRSVLAVFIFLTVILDYYTGSTIRFPAAYAIPILISAWYEGFIPGACVGVGLISVRFGLERFVWTNVPWGINESLINALTTTVFVLLLTCFTALAGRLSREVQLLGGLLPVCIFCHRFHDEHDEWREFEEYIMERSQAMLRRTICPKCVKKNL